ncbi:MAG: HAD-IIA family hydrolase [Actinomycetota bacterium]|nr:HAD-IIA family hydrolase [Actinomycetota bacterium]
MISADISNLVCDMDGVLYRGNEVIPGAPEAVALLRQRGVRVLFCTNNSNATVLQYVEKLTSLGIESRAEEILSSAVVTEEVLQERGLGNRRALVVGGAGLHQAATNARLTVERDPERSDVDIVLVGWDRQFDYATMRRAATAVRNGATFIASNDDATFPASDGLWPGAGAILASIETAAGRRAEVVGKPHPPMTAAIARRLDGAGRIAAVGDRPDTDLAIGSQMGWMTILVLSGVTSRAEVALLDPQPDLVVESIADLG